MAVNKVIFCGEVLVDMSQVTVNPERLVAGETALNASGELITGSNPYEKSATDAEVSEQEALLDLAIAALQGKAAGGGESGSGGMTADEYIQKGISGHYENKTILSVRPYGFAGNTEMTSVDLPNVENIETWAFQGCDNLKLVVLRRTDDIVYLGDYAETTFPESITVLVPQDFIHVYQTNYFWASFADLIHPVEDYTVDGTVTGELDWELLEDAFSQGNGYLIYMWDTEFETWVPSGSTLNGEPGMQWIDWVGSEYNIIGFILDLDNGRVVTLDGSYCVVWADGTPVEYTETIDYADGIIAVMPTELVNA